MTACMKLTAVCLDDMLDILDKNMEAMSQGKYK